MKNVDKKAIKAAIDAELKKELIVEFGGKIFDAPARAAGAVGNMFSGIGGQMKLGAINKELTRVAKRIDDDWNAAEDVVTKLANKMSTAKNPNIQQKAAAVSQNLQSVSSDLRNASGKLKQMASSGADSAQPGGNDINSKLGIKRITDKYGFSKDQSAVDRWIADFGGDLGRMSKPEQGKLQKMFFDLLSAGIDPFEVPKDKQEMLRQYHNFRMAEIADAGNDPFPNYEHFEKVLGPQVAEKMRQNDKGYQANQQNKGAQQDSGDEEEMDGEDMPPQAPQQAAIPPKQKAAPMPKQANVVPPAQPVGPAAKPANVPPQAPAMKAPPAAMPASPPPAVKDEYEKLAANITPELKAHIQSVFERAKKSGVKKDMLGKYITDMLPGPEDKNYMDPNDTEFLKKLNNKYNPPANHFGGGDFVNKTNPSANWQNVANLKPQTQQKSVPLPPTAKRPPKKVLPPNQSITSFFGDEQEPDKVPSIIKKPPVKNLGGEVQVGSEKSPAMMPRSLMMPQSLQTPKKLRPKSKSKNS